MLRLITQTRWTCRKKTKASNEEEGKEEGNGKEKQEAKKEKGWKETEPRRLM